MEVSYIYPKNPQLYGLHSFHDLGTLALQQSGKNILQTKESHKRIMHKIQTCIQRWSGYPQLKGTKIAAYAMGSAIRSLLSCGTYRAHNQMVSLHKIDTRITEIHSSLLSTENILQAELPSAKLAYGLPTYVELLRKFDLQVLYMCGYGLRYGVYLNATKTSLK